MGPNRSGRSPGISALAVALVVAGCASTGANPASAGEETVSITSVDGSINADLRLTRDDQASGGDVTAPLETVWASIPAAFERVGLPAPQLDRSRRTAVVSNHVVRRRLGEHRLSRLLRCGRGITQPHADTHRVHLAVVTWLEALSDETTRVRTRVQAMAENPEGTTAPARCSTRGELEQLLASTLQSEVQDG